LACAQARYVGAAATGFSLRAAVGRTTDMPIAGSRRIERRVDAGACEGGASRAFGKRRTADIAEAEEKDGGPRNFSIASHIDMPPHKVEPTFNLRLCPALLAMLHNR
jgi:hypothetical protein